jgi:hypothetical protein
MEKERLRVLLELMVTSISTHEVFSFTDQRQRESGQLQRIFKDQQVHQEVMEEMEQMERAQSIQM